MAANGTIRDVGDYRSEKSKALELLAAGDARGAFAEFRGQLEYPGKVEPRTSRMR